MTKPVNSPEQYVVLNPTEAANEVQEKDIYEWWVKDKVAPYKKVNGGVIFTDTIPNGSLEVRFRIEQAVWYLVARYR